MILQIRDTIEKRSIFMKKYFVEAVGTFFLVLTIGLSQGNPFAVGGILVTMIYMGGYISGGHYNPAVSLAVYIRGKLDRQTTVFYIISQLLGSLAAASVYFMITAEVFTPKPALNTNAFAVILIEALFTFALCSVVLHVATSAKNIPNQYFGAAIGGTVMAGIFAAAPISGAVFNPAVIVGPYLYDIAHLGANLHLLVWYMVATTIGSLAAGFAFKNIIKEK